MVVDGKRPDYSEGLTYFDCASILKWLGAYNAMACDQGGSSCMYIQSMGGIINRPADSDGLERPVYSHFGISM
jgi:exopolysaccharide biosynthesis protein